MPTAPAAGTRATDGFACEPNDATLALDIADALLARLLSVVDAARM